MLSLINLDCYDIVKIESVGKSLYILDYFFVFIILYVCYIYFRLEKKVFMFKKENDFFYFVFLLSR